MDKKPGVRPDTGGARVGNDLLRRRHLHLRPKIQRPPILQSHKVSESFGAIDVVTDLHGTWRWWDMYHKLGVSQGHGGGDKSSWFIGNTAHWKGRH